MLAGVCTTARESGVRPAVWKQTGQQAHTNIFLRRGPTRSGLALFRMIHLNVRVSLSRIDQPATRQTPL